MLVAGLISLIFGMYLGLTLLGLNLPFQLETQTHLHGPLMVCGFLGTIICLERAVAIGERWAYIAPLASATGALLLIAGLDASIGATFTTIASLILCSASLKIYFVQRELFTFALIVAAICWLIGCILWVLGFNLPQVTPWWMGFLIITIVGERLELSRFIRPIHRSKVLFILALIMFLAGAGVASLNNWPDVRLLSASLIVMTVWLMRNDIVRYTIKQTGLTRYIAIALICGYGWLLLAGFIGLCLPQLKPRASYDAFTHAIFLGFVFSMIFGHAPIIFPAITKVKIPYHPSLYLSLILLQISLMLRLSGDFLTIFTLRKAGGVMHAVTIIIFISILVMSVVRDKK